MVKLELDVGSDLRSAASEVAAAWKAAEAGELAHPSDKIIFVDWQTLCTVLTVDRYDLLRTIHKMPGIDLASLAGVLGRDTRSIELDIEALIDIGLALRSETGAVSTSVDEIASTIRFAA